MKKILIHSLLKTYSYLTIGIIIFFASIVAYTNYVSYLRTVEQAEQEVLGRLTEDMTYYYRRLKNDVYNYSRDSHKLDGIEAYFQLSPADYQMWLLHHPLADVIKLSFHDNINRIYMDNAFVEGIDLALVGEKEVFTSKRSLKSGKKVTATSYKSPQNAFSMAMYEPYSAHLFATVFISIDMDHITTLVENETEFPMSVAMTDSLGNPFYTLNPTDDDLDAQNYVDGNVHIAVGVPKSYTFQEVSRLAFFIFLSSLGLIGILLLLLKRIFYHYQSQIEDLVNTMQTITHADTSIRIDTTTKRQELYLIANQINQMLDSLDKNIKDIYQLQLAQKDADMRALQAQINPHFLYNTLEFFRMYAVTRDEDELADMIYEFSSLLRGSISQKPETTVAEELAFCEKHSYVCQIRYPKSIAYAYQIDKGCEGIVLPRFCIQPLVENYFVHGIDLTKRDNALSVKVLRQEDGVEILIRDNGKGMSEEIMADYQRLLANRSLRTETGLRSIGLLNVHERLLLYFGEAYDIHLSETPGGGVTYSIRIKTIVTGEMAKNV
ncbi:MULTISPECIES: sensor histidine kinase [Streptococcus]|uniref:Sensor histidine kinase n=1 Tax=Streptococcus caledonicus TaxID=2614158 RepID=A0ABW0UFR4_9STRE|nr:sensor histidine kinase [Streptococcus sp. S784/96/1]